MSAINLPIISKFDDKGVKEAKGAFDGIGSSLGKLAGLVAAAFSVRALTDFAKESIAAAEGVAVANQRIDQIAKSMNIFGDQTQEVADRLKSYAEANELTLATDAEVIKATQAKLLTFKELAKTADDTGGAFDRATAAAVDLAAAGFGTAETNAIQLGKALQDPIKGISALRRAGITFTDAEKEKIKTLVESGKILEAQNLVLSAIETQVGGTAAATATASAKMKLAFDNVKETVGGALMPAFAALAEAMIPIAEEVAPVLADAVTNLVPAFQEFAGFIPKVIDAIVPLIPALVEIAGAVVELAVELLPVFVEILDAIVPVLKDLIPLFLDLFEQAIKPIIPAIVDLIKAIGPIIQKILPVLITLIEALLPPFLTLLEELFIPLIPVILEIIDAFLPLIYTVLPILADILESVLIPLFLTIVDFFTNVLVGAIGIFKGAITILSGFIKGFSDTFTAIWEGIKTVVTGVVSFIGSAITTMVNGAVGAINSVIQLANQALTLIGQVTAGAVNIQIPTLPAVQAPAATKTSTPTPAKKTPAPTPAKTPIKIPKLAMGGIVLPEPGGVLANLAEGGQAEAVIPLNRLNEFTGGNNVTINITAGMGSDPVSIGREVVNAIKRYESVSGRVFASA